MLHFDESAPLTYDEFITIVSPFVSTKYQQYLAAIKPDASVDDSISHPFFISYLSFLSLVKHELNTHRLISHKDMNVQEGSHKGLIQDALVYEVVKKAVEQENPLEAEISLLRLLYNKVEELKGSHFFDEVSLFAYALQLRMLERKGHFIPIEGNTEFKRLFTGLQSIIKSI
jgi:hypothetical protein